MGPRAPAARWGPWGVGSLPESGEDPPRAEPWCGGAAQPDSAARGVGDNTVQSRDWFPAYCQPFLQPPPTLAPHCAHHSPCSLAAFAQCSLCPVYFPSLPLTLSPLRGPGTYLLLRQPPPQLLHPLASPSVLPRSDIDGSVSWLPATLPSQGRFSAPQPCAPSPAECLRGACGWR